MRKRIYIAGPLSPKGNRKDTAHPAIEYLLNCRDMVQTAIRCIGLGWAPFCPALDFMYFMALPTGYVISEEAIKDQSLAWLEVSDAILMVGEWKQSGGACAEMQMAADLEIPIYYDIMDVPLRTP